jgi:hypothetical protein
MEWLATWLKSLTFTNVAIIALIAMVAIPVYATYKLMTDPSMLDRFMSSYDEYTEVETGCTVRTVRLRGGPWRWSISTGFAFQGSDRWTISVILSSEPKPEDIISYCATLELVVEKMLGLDNSSIILDGLRRSAVATRRCGVQCDTVSSSAADEGRYEINLRQEIPGATAEAGSK